VLKTLKAAMDFRLLATVKAWIRRMIIMSEEIKNPQPDSQDPQKQPGNTADQTGGQKDEPKFTQAEVNAIVQDRLSRMEKKYSDKLSKLSEYEKQIAEFNKQAEEKRRAEMSELDKLKEDLAKKDELLQQLTQEKDGILGKFRTQTINTAFKEVAAKHDIEHLNAAMKLAKEELSALEVDEDGNVEGIEEMVKKLVEENPFLVSQKQPKKPVGAPTNPANRAEEKSSEQRIKEAYEKAKRTGNPEDLLAYRKLKRQLGM
jgi:chromosome segregation ATPase